MQIMQTLNVLLLTALTSPIFAQSSPDPSPPAQLASIVENMERAQSQISIPNHEVRDYRLSRPNSAKVDSYVLAEVDFRPPGKFAIKQRSGSSIGEAVVRRILADEIGTAVSIEKSAGSAVTRRNYVFAYLGDGVLGGHSYYLLHLDPKRKEPKLISGQAWVDKDSFLIRRIEGKIAKSPSWWVKKLQVEFDFTATLRMWVLSSMEAVADIRCVGAQELTSHVLDYGTDTAVAAKSGDENHALAGGPSPILTVAVPSIQAKHE